MPLKILHLIAELNGYGETRQLKLLAQQQLATGDTVSLVALAADPKVESNFRQLAIDSKVLKRRWTADPIEACRLQRILKSTEADIIHTWGQAALNYTLAVHPPTAPPIVATLFEAPRNHFFWNWYRMNFWGEASHTVVPTLGVEQDCHQHGLARESSSVIPLSIAGPNSNRVTRKQFCEELGIASNIKVIAIAGPLVRSKRIDNALWCFELVRTLDENTHLVIFGDGADRFRLERYARLVSEVEAVSFLGYRTDMLDLLPHVDVLWQPGEETTLASVMLEAMAAGVPVVASNVPVHQEVIEDGKNGLLFPVGSRAGCARQTQRLMNEAEQTAELVATAKQWAANEFSTAGSAKAYAEVYHRVHAK